MSALRTLVRQALSYFSGRLAVMLAGLISLPVLTRLLPREQYGLMSLVFLSITITTSLCALGFPQSTTRYFADYASRGAHSLRQFCSAMMTGGFAAGAIATLLAVFVGIALTRSESFGEMALHLRYAAILILIRIVTSVCLQILRGNQQTFGFNVINIANRYLAIGAIVLLLLFVYPDVTAVFVGTICVEAAVLVIALAYLVRKGFLGIERPRASQFRRAVRFGMPLVIADLMVSLVASTDRFAIQYFMDADAVAVYSVAYDISDYVAIMFASPLQLAILPIVYSLWSEEGVEATRDFLNRAVNLSFALIIPMIAGFSLVGPDVVTTLASDKFTESAEIVPLVACGVMLGSVHFLLFTGLLLHEKTRVITTLNAVAAALNLVLNITLIPSFGILGAAYATLLTYILLDTITYFVSGRYLRIELNFALLTKAGAATAVMAVVLLQVRTLTGHEAADVLIRSVIGAVLYGSIMYAIEPRTRQLAHAAARRLRSLI